MIKRIVKMTFLEGKESTFLEIYEQVQKKIRNMDGCNGLELVRDMKETNIFFTISVWKDDDALQNYRQTELFQTTWSQVKVLFARKAEAWSTLTIAKLHE